MNQLAPGDRFRDKFGAARLQQLVADKFILAVSGHEQYPGVGPPVDPAPRQFRPGHAWHHDIRDEQIDRLPEKVEKLERLLAGRGFHYLKAGRLDLIAEELPDEIVILHQQNSARGAALLRSPLEFNRALRRFGQDARKRKRNMKFRTPAGFRLDFDRPRPFGDQAMHDRHPEIGSLAALPPEERFEDPAPGLLRHASSRIPGVERRPPGTVQASRYREGAAPRHRIARVDGEVNQHLLNLRSIRSDRQAPGTGVHRQRAGRPEDLPKHSGARQNRPTQIENFGLHRIVPAHRQ